MPPAIRKLAGTPLACDRLATMDLIAWLVVGAVASLVIWLGCATWTAAAAIKRGGRTLQWVFLGALLGPVGPLIVLRVLSHRCPNCDSPVLRSVHLCPACNTEVPRLATNPAGAMWTYRRNW